MHEKTPAQRRTEIAAALAAALGKPAADMTKALDSVLPDRPAGGPGEPRSTRAATSPRRWRRRSAWTRPRCRPGSTRPARTSARTAGDGDRRFDRGTFEDTVVDDIASARPASTPRRIRSALQDLQPDRGAVTAATRGQHPQRARGPALGMTTVQLQPAIEKVRNRPARHLRDQLAQKLTSTSPR